MKKTILILFSLALLAVQLSASAPLRTRENFDFDWYFHLEGDPETEIQLPHDWSTTLEFNPKEPAASGYLGGGIGWYRKQFSVPTIHKGKRISVVFDGIYHKASIYLNGKQIAYHRYGYTSFEVDLTPYIHFGETNELCVKVDHAEASRWYTGSGIYRHAWLQITNAIHVKTWGTYVTTSSINAREATVRCQTTIENNSVKASDIELIQTIFDDKGKPQGKKAFTHATVPESGSMDLGLELSLPNPKIWDIDSPSLYTLVTEIKKAGRLIDRYETRFGVRDVKFDTQKGFLLNGRKVRLQGVCLHQDAGCLGVAVPDRSFERRLTLLKEFGVNAVRCSHNPPAPEFLDYCDSLGLLVIDEAFDKWKSGYYEQFFDDCWKEDIGDMLIRDRNHPSIILWSIGNELAEAGLKTDEGVQRAKMLQDFVHLTEPSRKVMLALQPWYEDKFASVTDVVGYNYSERAYIEDKKKHPERIGLISESFPYYSGLRAYEPRSYSENNPWNFIQDNDFICGSFMWAGVEYTGESMGWPSKGWAAALFDVTMTPKQIAPYFRSVWNSEPTLGISVVDYSLDDEDPGKDHWQAPPMVHDWTFPYSDSRVIPIHTPSNCDELVLIDPQGKIYGPRRPEDYINQTVIWNQPYRPGTITVIGYKGGVEVCRDSIRTSASKADHYSVLADRMELKADGQDLSHVDLQLYDSAGIPIRIDNRIVSARVEGAGRLLGLNSGQMRRTQRLDSPQLPTYRGRLQAIVQAGRNAGPLRLILDVEGLGEQVLDLEVK